MAQAGFRPYADDAAVTTVGDLTVENGTARIVLHGGLELTRDAAGLARARALERVLGAIVQALAAEDLPDAVEEPPAPVGQARNPFA